MTASFERVVQHFGADLIADQDHVARDRRTASVDRIMGICFINEDGSAIFQVFFAPYKGPGGGVPSIELSGKSELGRISA